MNVSLTWEMREEGGGRNVSHRHEEEQSCGFMFESGNVSGGSGNTVVFLPAPTANLLFSSQVLILHSNDLKYLLPKGCDISTLSTLKVKHQLPAARRPTRTPLCSVCPAGGAAEQEQPFMPELIHLYGRVSSFHSDYLNDWL